jgi:hypothetical protein
MKGLHGTAEEAAEKVRKADSLRAELHPTRNDSNKGLVGMTEVMP